MIESFFKTKYAPRWIIFICDLILITTSFLFSFFLIRHLLIDVPGILGFLPAILINMVVYLICVFVFPIYKGIIRYSEINDIFRIIKFASLQFALWLGIYAVDANAIATSSVPVALLIINLFTIGAFAQNQTNQIPIVSPDSAVVFRLFSTRNTWTFIKLNTRNGQLWQVQWDTGKEQFEMPISLISRISREEERNGRFFLYPTQNIYNFLLLDQLDGRVWQVQWSTVAKERIVVPIN